MDNFESIFQTVREQLEDEILRLNRQSRQQPHTNINTEESLDADLTFLLREYVQTMRSNQDIMSTYNLNMTSIIDIIRRQQRQRSERRNEEEQRSDERQRNERNSIFEPNSLRFRNTTPRYNGMNNNAAFSGNANFGYQRPSIFGISDISRNLRSNAFASSLHTPATHFRTTQMDPRHFFGGLGPELRNVIVRPSNAEIERSTRIFTYSQDMELLNSRCYITMEDFEEGDNLRQILHCRHTFKTEPLMNWFRESVRCPVCRYDVRDYIPTYISEVETNESISSRRSSGQSLNTSTDTIPQQSFDSPSHISQDSIENLQQGYALPETLFTGEDGILNQNLTQEISNGINELLENLLVDISNSSINQHTPLSYSLSVPIIYHEFFDASNNLSFNNLQFNRSP
jgi:hypothetical protein|uniref:RING-type domain-containing protein n=1 Tax=viral metagenome TaxID=1070528 RepID=A0A6C0IS45_9ZZZZ